MAHRCWGGITAVHRPFTTIYSLAARKRCGDRPEMSALSLTSSRVKSVAMSSAMTTPEPGASVMPLCADMSAVVTDTRFISSSMHAPWSMPSTDKHIPLPFANKRHGVGGDRAVAELWASEIKTIHHRSRSAYICLDELGAIVNIECWGHGSAGTQHALDKVLVHEPVHIATSERETVLAPINGRVADEIRHIVLAGGVNCTIRATVQWSSAFGSRSGDSREELDSLRPPLLPLCRRKVV